MPLHSRWFLGISKSMSPPVAAYFSVKLCRPISVIIWWFTKLYFIARWMAAVPSEELRTVLWMFVFLLTANLKFRNRSTCSKGPLKRDGKVCGDSQDLKSPGLMQRPCSQSAKNYRIFPSSVERSSRNHKSSNQRHPVFFFGLIFDHSKLESLCDISVTRIGDALSYGFPQTVTCLSFITFHFLIW